MFQQTNVQTDLCDVGDGAGLVHFGHGVWVGRLVAVWHPDAIHVDIWDVTDATLGGLISHRISGSDGPVTTNTFILHVWMDML
jgi:hypothetical protein